MDLSIKNTIGMIKVSFRCMFIALIRNSIYGLICFIGVALISSIIKESG